MFMLYVRRERKEGRKRRRHTGSKVQPQLTSTITAQIGKKDDLSYVNTC
jgi:hypothetical protein